MNTLTLLTLAMAPLLPPSQSVTFTPDGKCMKDVPTLVSHAPKRSFATLIAASAPSPKPGPKKKPKKPVLVQEEVPCPPAFEGGILASVPMLDMQPIEPLPIVAVTTPETIVNSLPTCPCSGVTEVSYFGGGYYFGGDGGVNPGASFTFLTPPAIPSPIPEPSVWLMLALGLIAVRRMT